MSKGNAFVWLSGTVTVPAPAPRAWRDDGLKAFYQDPNNPVWGGSLCRVLYHESIHFWQLLSSAYLANAVQDEWLRLQQFERTGELRPPGELVAQMAVRQPDEPFSAHELMECWARYWDVHTRNPAQIIEEDGIVADNDTLRTRHEGIDGYTSEAFDLFMQAGKDAALYAAPYRWMLAECNGNSALANTAFPILVFHAFGSPNPVRLLRRSLARALDSKLVWSGMATRSGNINLDWLNNWSVFAGEAIAPARQDLRMPDFTAGWDVISRGPLGTHPIYGPYGGRVRALLTMARLGVADAVQDDSMAAAYAFAVADLPVHDPRVIFAFPGQPVYRLTLGEHLPPPRVRFDGFTVHAQRNPVSGVLAKLAAQSGETPPDDDVSFETCFSSFDARLARFRDAEYAVSVGLPATTFERQLASTR